MIWWLQRELELLVKKTSTQQRHYWRLERIERQLEKKQNMFL